MLPPSDSEDDEEEGGEAGVRAIMLAYCIAAMCSAVELCA